jgi:hypothetical protein
MGRWGTGRARWVPAVLLACVALLAVVPAALAAEGTGQISGTVTKAVGGEAIKGIEVCASGADGGGGLEEAFFERCAQTGATGLYTITELPGGPYDVEFLVPVKSPLNYVTQYYNDRPSFTEAQAVSVTPGVTAEGVDAKMQVGGEITGTVTDGSTHNALSGIDVSAVREASGEEFSFGAATTEADGEYTMRGLAAGSYKVEFSPGFESSLNYVTQYYDGQSSPASATPVTVTQGSVTPGIDAALEAGGEITGTVTDATTHVDLPNIAVLAIGASEASGGFAITNTSGQYTIQGLATGSYKLEFISAGEGSSYIAQFYNGAATLASATPVAVTQGSTTSPINAALVPKRPIEATAPNVSGTPAVGATLTCSNGTWTGSPAPTFTHLWLRNGSPIAGATGSSYVVQAADQGAGLACRVTATNKSGSAAAVSNTLTVTPLVAHPLPIITRTPFVALSSTRIVVSGGSARVPLLCTNASCAGTIELTQQVVVKQRKGKKTISKKKTVVLAKGSYALAAGKSATIAVRLTPAGRSALAKAKGHKLSVKAIVFVTGGTKVTKPVVLSMAAPAKRKPKRK